ncbi:658_t:CDS:2, partial [Ambispora leptoticha]
MVFATNFLGLKLFLNLEPGATRSTMEQPGAKHLSKSNLVEWLKIGSLTDTYRYNLVLYGGT